ncbi:MAG: L,D-transpeptidase family protein [Planctomycetaceae bacterium]
MQTLKTAIVVLLLMTVMYGSYVSLTTPPEPLPDAVASLIQESDTFNLGIEDGVADSLPTFTIDDGQTGETAASPIDSAPLDFAPPPFPDQSAPSQLASLTAPPIPDTGDQAAVTGSLSDASMTLSPASTPAEGPAATSIAGLEDLQLPKAGATSVPPSIDPSRDYPATGSEELSLPDPRSLAALPNSGWNKEANATPVSFGMPAKADSEKSSTELTLPSQAKADTPPSLAPPQDSRPDPGLANAIRTADRQYAADQHNDALATLSLFYNSPELSPADRSALISRLDPLAASVIYSRKHLLEQPYRGAANDTLMEIAARYELPWQLLANINGIEDPVAVLPGTELKVLRGPFRAEIDLQRNELTIFLRDLYAGRFGIAVGDSPAPEAGTYTIQDKQSARTFYDNNGSPVPPGDSRNPYGTVWMDLGKQLCIHGSPERAQPTDQGCISLRGVDAEDLYGILGQGSSVTIRR